MQADLLTLIDISNHFNSVSHTWRRRWRAETGGASNIILSAYIKMLTQYSWWVLVFLERGKTDKQMWLKALPHVGYYYYYILYPLHLPIRSKFVAKEWAHRVFYNAKFYFDWCTLWPKNSRFSQEQMWHSTVYLLCTLLRQIPSGSVHSLALDKRRIPNLTLFSNSTFCDRSVASKILTCIVHRCNISPLRDEKP